MNNNTKLLLGLLRDYIQQVSSEETIRKHTGEIEWEQILKLAQVNNVLPFVYSQVKSFGGQFGIDLRHIVYLKNVVIYRSSDQMRMNMCLNEILNAFDSKQIEYYVLKGIILADLYPHPEYRYSSDIDIHIDESQLDGAMKAFESIGYRYERDYDSDKDYKFFTPDNHMVELHTQLFTQFYEKHKMVFDNINLKSENFATTQDILGREVRTLKPNEFLIYLFCHITKHFIASGINIRHLMDISIYINKHREELDFYYITNILEQLKIKNCVLSFIHICITYLGMNKVTGNIPMTDETIIEVLIYDIAEKRANNDPTKSFSENNYDKMYGKLRYYKYKKSSLLNVIFPKVSLLKKNYAYVNRHWIFIPIAWLHRLFHHLFGIFRSSEIEDTINRTNLLTQLDLLK
jgi:hypothetical protein